MKKIQTTFTILLVAGLLLLSGCDAILEVFYPEFAFDKGGNNVISIWTGFDMYPGQLSTGSQYIIARLLETGTDDVVREIAIDPFWHWIEEKNNLYWQLEGNLDFYGVEDGEYRVVVWLEQSGDDNPNGPNEPSVNAVNTADGSVYFSLPSADAPDGWLFGEAISPLY